MKKIFFLLIIVLLLMYGIFLRWYALGSGSFWIDEWYSSFIAYQMLQNNFIPMLWDGTLVFWQYFFHFLQSISFYFFWTSDFSARLVSALFGILYIIIFFIFSYHISQNFRYKKIWFLFLISLFLFSTWQIIWAREARFYEMLSFLFFITYFFLYQYLQTYKNVYLLWFWIFCLFWVIFHQFFMIFFLLSCMMIFFFDKKKVHYKYTFLWTVFFIGVWYTLVQFLFHYLQSGNLATASIVPNINYLQEYNFFEYFFYYIGFLYEQLWIIFLFFIWGIFYFLFHNKEKEALLFWGWILGSIIFISFWFFAHSRYVFHLFWIILLIWWYSLFLFCEYILTHYSYKWKKVILFSVFIFLWFFLVTTYKTTLIPYKFFYIDFTSPKPNFKSTYAFISQHLPDYRIISWFPHLCVWYNQNNSEICQYALRVDLIWHHKVHERILQKTHEQYTHIEYIKNIQYIDMKKHIFVIDDLTLKNAIDKQMIQYIKEKCILYYRDIWNAKEENFIWVWKCDESEHVNTS